MMSSPPRRFLAPNGRTSSQPLRELHDGGDPPEVVARIAAATAMCDEPECMSRAIIDAQSDLARTYSRLRHLANIEHAQRSRKDLPIDARIADVQRRAKQQHVDVSHEVHLARQQLDRARRGGRGDPLAAIGRVERIEAVLDHRPDLDEAA